MATVQHHILSNYTLSAPYRKKLEALFGPSLHHVNVSELRQTSLRALVSALRSLRGAQLTVAVEDESTLALLPLLRLLASISRSDRLQIIDPQFVIQKFGRFESIVIGVQLVFASVRSAISLLVASQRLRSLSRQPRFEASVQQSGRVAYLNCNLWFGVKAGGSVGHISGVANSFMDRGLALDFFTVGGRLMVDSRATFHQLVAPKMLSLPFETTYYRFHFDCVDQINSKLLNNRPSFLYQRLSLGNYTGVTISRKLGIPLILEYNGSEAWVAKNWGKPLRFHSAAVAAEDACLRHAHIVVTVSDPLGDELERRGVERHRIVVYPNCIDPKMFDPALFQPSELSGLRRKFGFADSDIVATFIGTFGQWHGVDILAAAIRRMIEEESDFLRAQRVRFLLVGDGQKMSLVRKTLDIPGAGEFVTLTGLVPQHEAPMYLAASNILLSPHVANTDGSAFFGSPTKLFEYMAMGKAIYASDLDQIGVVLANSLRVSDLDAYEINDSMSCLALLGRPGSIEDLVVGLRFLVGNERCRKILGENARREALSKYTWDKHVGTILDRIQSLK